LSRQEVISSDITLVSAGERRGSMRIRRNHRGGRALRGKVGRTDFRRLRISE
jgi:hypothetical protein